MDIAYYNYIRCEYELFGVVVGTTLTLLLITFISMTILSKTSIDDDREWKIFFKTLLTALATLFFVIITICVNPSKDLMDKEKTMKSQDFLKFAMNNYPQLFQPK